MKQCDLVMRGGITSGVVYPQAIVGLSNEYQFRQVGGASAGAIAAAFAAAAELGRGAGGFDRLAEIPTELGQGLTRYFQPYGRYAKLFDQLIDRLDKKKKFGVWFFIRNFRRIKRALGDLPETQYGICPGTTRGGPTGSGLIDWMNRRLEYVAGRIDDVTASLPAEPLTFGMLKAQNIELRLISSNISQGRPFNLPLGKGFRLRRADLDWLLPANVARWIERNYAATDDDEFVDLPPHDDMPVILAVRMSLAFPVLFSAVPIYSRDFSLRVDTSECRDMQKQYQLNLFSDGGLSSNFPIHYFDAALPTRPTFGINLTSHHACRHGEDITDDGWNRIYLPHRARGGITFGVNPVDGLVAFAGAILNTAKDWQDSVQMRLPGYRERIVHVALKDDEGGINLTMPSATLDRLIQLGENAATRIVQGHDTDPAFDMAAHRWRRLLAATVAIEESIAGMADAYLKAQPGENLTLKSMQEELSALEQQLKNGVPFPAELGYPTQDHAELAKLRARWDAILALHDSWTTNALDPNWNMPSPTVSARLRSQEF